MSEWARLVRTPAQRITPKSNWLRNLENKQYFERVEAEERARQERFQRAVNVRELRRAYRERRT